VASGESEVARMSHLRSLLSEGGVYLCGVCDIVVGY